MRKFIAKLPKVNYQNLFLQDVQSDFMILLNEKVFPVHRRILQENSALTIFNRQNQKVLLINSPFDPALFQKILSFLYGFQISLERNKNIIDAFNIIRALRLKVLEKQILSDICQNLDQYGLFSMMNISMKMSYPSLYEKCLLQLLELNFQQLFINKFDLYGCEKQFFQYVLNQLNEFQSKGIIKGISNPQRRQIINQYQNMNNQIVKVDFIKEGKGNQKQNGITRKRSSSCQISSTKSIIISKQIQEINQSILLRKFSSQKSSQKSNENAEEQQQNLNDLKNVNQKMIKTNNRLKMELEKIQKQLRQSDSIGSNEDVLSQISQKMQKIKQNSQKNQQIFKKLKNKVKKISQQSGSEEKKAELSEFQSQCIENALQITT